MLLSSRLAAISVALICGIAVGQQCNVRFVNEYPSIVTLAVLGGDNLDTQDIHGAGDYISTVCNSTLSLTSVTGSASISFNAVPGSSSTVFAYETAAPLAVSLFNDATEVIEDQSYTIEVCNIRFISGRAGTTLVNGVNGECYNCSHLNLGSVELGQVTPYYQVYCAAVPFSVQGQALDGSYNDSGTAFPTVEHGSYTIVLQNLLPNSKGEVFNPPLSFLVDVDGPYPYWPLVITPFVLFAFFITHYVTGLAFRRFGCFASYYETASGSTKTLADEGGFLIFFLAFFGFDDAIKAGAADRREKLQKYAKNDDDSSVAFLDTATAGGSNSTAVSASASSKAPKATKMDSRILAVDTLRGLSLCFMIFVNYGGAKYTLLDHAKWNGLHLADILFPSFMWMSGLSMAISFDGRWKRGATRSQIAQEVLVRAMKLYALGCFINGGYEMTEWRMLGVLQYFAMSYLIVGLVQVVTHVSDDGSDSPSSSSSSGGSKKKQDDSSINSGGGSGLALDAESLRSAGFYTGGSESAAAASAQADSEDLNGCKEGCTMKYLRRYGPQWALMLIIAITYLVLQSALPLPEGCPTGYIGPGGLADQGAYLGMNCTGGAHRVIDMAIYGPRHVYHYDNSENIVQSSATCSGTFNSYDCDIFDPEGALGWLSASWLCFFGLQAGLVIVNHRKLLTSAVTEAEKRSAVLAHVIRWFSWGILLGLIGGGLCGFSKEGGLIPINKNLWSPSFVFVISGIDFCCLAILYLVVDVFKLWNGTPFRYAGMNSILVYCGSELLDGCIPFAVVYDTSDTINHGQEMASNVVGVASWLIVARLLYMNKVFVNV